MLLPYTIIISILFLILYGRNRNGGTFVYLDDSKFDKQCLILFFLFFYVLFAFRSIYVGNDTIAYVFCYKNISSLTFFKTPEYARFEIGYIFYNRILTRINSCPQFLFIISGIIILTSFYKLIVKYSDFLLLSVFLFFTMRIFDDTLNILRHCLAYCCIINSYLYLRKVKSIPFVLWVLIATLFHKSAIVFLLAWFVNKIEITNKIICIWAIGIFMVIILSPFIISVLINFNVIPKYYLNTDYFSNGKIAPFLNLFISLLLCIFGFISKSYKCSHKIDGVFDNKNMLIFQMIASFLLTFTLHFTALLRVALYFQYFSIVFLPNSLKCFKNKNNFMFFLGLIVLFFTLHFFIIITYRPDWNRIYPYSFSNLFCTL